VEQAYVDSLHTQLETRRAQMAHDRLKIDGLEKQVERLRKTLEGIEHALQTEGFGIRFQSTWDAIAFTCVKIREALASTPETPRATPSEALCYACGHLRGEHDEDGCDGITEVSEYGVTWDEPCNCLAFGPRATPGRTP
jgi:hypothetical protein